MAGTAHCCLALIEGLGAEVSGDVLCARSEEAVLKRNEAEELCACLGDVSLLCAERSLGAACSLAAASGLSCLVDDEALEAAAELLLQGVEAVIEVVLAALGAAYEDNLGVNGVRDAVVELVSPGRAAAA